MCGRVAIEVATPKARAAATLTVAGLVERYAEHAKTNLTNWRLAALHGSYWVEFMGDKLIEDVQPADIEAYKTERLSGTQRNKTGKRVSPTTVNKEVRRLGRLYELARKDRITTYNPTRLVDSLKEPVWRYRYLDDGEEIHLQPFFLPRFWVLVDFAMRTGLRRGEQFGLLRTDLDFQGECINLRETKNRRGRVIPMSPALKELLLAWLAQEPASLWVFTSRTGKPFNGNNIRRRFVEVCRKASILNFTWHDLRHTYASRMVMARCDLTALKELMGHRDISMTMRYAHLAPGRLRTTQALLDARPLPPIPAKK